MSSSNSRKTLIWVAAVMLVIAGVAFGSYQYTKEKSYSTLISNANKCMNDGDYDKALSLFEQSLNYKKDPNVERSMTLAKELKESKASFDEGTKLMNDKKYTDAIAQFNKVSKTDDKLYSKAQASIEQCKKQYVEQNIKSANEAMKNKNYDDASKYLDEALKMDDKNADAKKLKEAVAKAKSDAATVSSNGASNNNGGKITQQDASAIVKKCAVDKGTDTLFEFDHEDTRNGIKYYVIHVYDNVSNHTATRAWYYVDANTGKAYEWDLVNNSLIPRN